MSGFYALAFCCFALIGGIFAQFKCFDGSAENDTFEVLNNNVLMKLLGNNDGGHDEMKQFVCDLIEQDIVLGAALDDPDQDQDFSHPHQPIRLALVKEYGLIMNAVDVLDKPTALLLHQLRNGIGTLKNAIVTGISVESAKDDAINATLKHAFFVLAEKWQIPREQQTILSKENKTTKMGPEDLLRELAKHWAEYKRQHWHYWNNDGKKTHEKCNYGHGQNEKRMLQLIMHLSNDGTSSGLAADLKGTKKRQRRRRKRDGNVKQIAYVAALLLLAILIVAGIIYCQCKKAPPSHHTAGNVDQGTSPPTSDEHGSTNFPSQGWPSAPPFEYPMHYYPHQPLPTMAGGGYEPPAGFHHDDGGYYPRTFWGATSSNDARPSYTYGYPQSSDRYIPPAPGTDEDEHHQHAGSAVHFNE